MTDYGTLALGASILSVSITAAAGYATHRSASKASERNQSTSSRTDIEKEAFERAKVYYTDTIDRQAEDLDTLREDLTEQARHHDEAITQLRTQHREELARVQALGSAQNRECREELAVLRRQLARATAALRARFPDTDLNIEIPGDGETTPGEGTLGT